MGQTANINPDTEPTNVTEADVNVTEPPQVPDAPGTDANGDGLKAEVAPEPSTPGDILNL